MKTQVVFCPSGAEWNYNFKMTAGGAPPPYSYSYVEKIKYVRDSIIGNNTFKVLKHHEFFLECENLINGLTLIKQNADTVFFRSQFTNHQWEVLYNFNAQVGQSWKTNFLSNPSYTVTVNSITTVTINGMQLKQLLVTFTRAASQYIYTAKITERFGCDGFLFNFYNHTLGYCDTQWFERFLCYTDNQIGNVQFTSYPCDYKTDRLGFNELKSKNFEVNISPNPFNNELKIESSESILNYKLNDVLGKLVQEGNLDDKVLNLKTDYLKAGIYFIQVQTKFGFETKKLVKE